MPIELQAHYLDLICQAIAAAGEHPIMRVINPGCGTLYACKSATSTKADYVVMFRFYDDPAHVELRVVFADQNRAKVEFKANYMEGIDEFFPLMLKALNGNKLTHQAAA